MKLSVDQLACLEPIRGLSPQRLAELASLCQSEKYPMGADPVASFADGMRFHYLLAGELKIVLPDGSMRLLVGGCDMANWPLGYKTLAPVSSKAVTDIEWLGIDFDLIDIMMTWDQLSSAVDRQPEAKIEESTSWSMMSSAFNARALTSGGLSQLPPAHIHELLKRFERIKVKRAQIIIQEGSAGDYYYLIEAGRCQVTRHLGGVEVTLAELKSGDAFGEEALVSESRRAASVRMKSDGVLLRLAKPDFVELLQAPLLHQVAWPEAAASVAAGQARWLDVRYPAEFAEDGLPGAINVPLSEIRTAFGLLDKKVAYMVYCHSGRRSSAATFLLAQQGFNARWLNGGLAAVEKK